MISRQKTLERQCLAAYTPPFELRQPSQTISPLIFASPHSGHIYPPALLALSSLELSDLRRNEDMFIDDLFACVSIMGAPLLRACFPRCFVDVNRAPDELPPDLFPATAPGTPRARHGLGIVPTIISENLGIYKRPLRSDAITARIEALYSPYHTALSTLIAQTCEQHGKATLIDCHSMPGFTPMGQRRADIILGDRHGMSCHPSTIDYVETCFKSRGYSVSRNHPYAGGYVTSHYGQPENNVEALQIEINRDLYLNPVSLKRKKSYPQLAQDIQDIVQDMLIAFQTDMLQAAQ